MPDRDDATSLKLLREDTTIPEERKQGVIDFVQRRFRGEVFLSQTSETHYDPHIVENLSLSRCYTCDKLAIWVHNAVVFPPTRHGAAPNKDLPEEIRHDYEEARSVLNLSPRGAAALLRLCIQKLCIHLNEPGKNLNDDIASLVKRGLDEHVQQALDTVRVVGNNAVHPLELDLRDDHDTAVTLLDLVNVIADEMISRRNRIRAVYEKKVPEQDRRKIAKRDSPKS